MGGTDLARGSKKFLSHPVGTLQGMASTSLTISCDDCQLQHSSACDDCLVTFLCDREPGRAVVVDVAERRALRLLSGAGLVPRLRYASGS